MTPTEQIIKLIDEAIDNLVAPKKRKSYSTKDLNDLVALRNKFKLGEYQIFEREGEEKTND